MEDWQVNEEKTVIDMAIEKIGLYPFITLLAIFAGPWGFILAGIVQSKKNCHRRTQIKTCPDLT